MIPTVRSDFPMKICHVRRNQVIARKLVSSDNYLLFFKFLNDGTFQLSKGIATVEFKNADTDGYVIIDSVRLLRQPHTP